MTDCGPIMLLPSGLIQNVGMFLIFRPINEEAPLQLLSCQRLGSLRGTQEWLHNGDSTAFFFIIAVLILIITAV